MVSSAVRAARPAGPRSPRERPPGATERIAPAHLIREAPAAEVMRFMMLKNVAFHGLRDGLLHEAHVEGQRGKQYLLPADLPLLEELLQGRAPAAWRPLGETTREAVTLLAPLDPVSARGRSARLFGFEYVWEVYKPLEKRKWGYYVLPILWDDALVARANLRRFLAAEKLDVSAIRPVALRQEARKAAAGA